MAELIPTDCLIYKLDLLAYQPIQMTVPEGAMWDIWRPSLQWPLRCTRFPYWYDLYWFFHYLGVFRNKSYCAVTLKTEQRTDAALMVVPTWFRWPFMQHADVQIIYVVTHPTQLRKGLAKSTMIQAVNGFKANQSEGNVWYVTTTDNLASQNLCTSLGFRLVGYGIRKKRFGFYKTLELQPIT